MESASPTRSWMPRAFEEGRWAPYLRHVYLVPILLVAVWLRFAGLGSEHLYGDEAEYAIVSRYLAADPTYLAYPEIEGNGPTPFVSQPPLVLYLMAISMKIFGATDFAAILPSVLFGVATVGVAYALGNRLGGRMMGLLGAGLLAVLPFHVELSRRAMLDAGYVFFVTLSLYFLVAWAQERTRRQAVWAGVAVAGAALSKLPGVLMVPVALAVFGVVLAVVAYRHARGRARPGELRQTLEQGGFGALPVAVGGLLYLGLLAYLNALTDLWVKLTWQLGRVDTSQAQAQEVTAVQRPWTFYLTDPQFSLPVLLGGAVFALALVGLAAMAVRFVMRPNRNAAQLVVPIGVLVLMTFFFWSDRKEGFYLLPFAPIAAVAVAGAAVSLKDMVTWAGIRFSEGVTTRAAPLAIALGVVLVAVPAWGAASDSYEEFALGDTQEKYFGYGTREAAQWIHEHDPEAGQYGTLLGRFALLWYNEQPTYHWYVDHTRMEIEIQQGDLKYIVYDKYLGLAFDERFMEDMIAKYNGKEVAKFEAGWGKVQVYELQPGGG